MLPVVTDLFKSTLDENLKKLVQPAGLVPAAFWLLFNVLLIILPLNERGIPAAGWFYKLDTLWQIAVSVALVLMLGFLLVNMRRAISRLFTGSLWLDSPLGILFRALQKKRYDTLMRRADAKTNADVIDRRRVEYELGRTFPSDPRYLYPTALGNVLNAISAYVWNRYGIDLVAFLPSMMLVIAKDATLIARLDDRKAALDFLINLAFVLGVFALEELALQVWFKSVDGILASFGFLIAAYVSYCAAVGVARDWGDEVQSVFDLYREELREQFGIREFKNPADERNVWREAGVWLLQGKDTADLIVQKPPASPVSYQASTNITLQVETGLTTRERTSSQKSATFEWEEAIHYTILISTIVPTTVGSQALPAKGVRFVIQDSRVMQVPPSIAIENAQDWQDTRIAATPIQTGDSSIPTTVLWSIDELPPNSSRALCYTLPGKVLFRASVTDAKPNALMLKLTELKQMGERKTTALYVLQLRNTGTAPVIVDAIEVRIENLDIANTLRASYLKKNQRIQLKQNVLARAEAHSWELDQLTLEGGEQIELFCRQEVGPKDSHPVLA